MADASSDETVRQSPDADSLSTVRSVGLNGDDLALCLLEQSEDCVKILSIDGTLDFMSCNGLGAMEIDDPSRVLGQLWWTLWPDNSRAMVEDNFKNALGSLQLQNTTHRSDNKWSAYRLTLTNRQRA